MNHLKIGDPAPDFTAKDQNGTLRSLKDYAGKKLILYFYPKDQTPGCTTEACNFRDNYQMLEKKGFAVVGVSVDGESSHQKFIQKHDLPFTLLADEDKKIVQDYGVWGEKSFMGRKFQGTHRKTFIIDGTGNIEHIIEKVKNKEASKQVLDLYD